MPVLHSDLCLEECTLPNRKSLGIPADGDNPVGFANRKLEWMIFSFGQLPFSKLRVQSKQKVPGRL